MMTEAEEFRLIEGYAELWRELNALKERVQALEQAKDEAE